MSAARRRLRIAAVAALVGVAPVVACYRYVPVPPATVPPNEEVHVRLTPSGATRLAPILGGENDELEGTVATRRDSLVVSVVVAKAYRGITFDSSRQAFALAPSEVADVRRREFSRSRTTIAAVGTVAAFAALTATIVAIADPNPSADEPLPLPPPPQARTPRTVRAPRVYPLRVRIPLP